MPTYECWEDINIHTIATGARHRLTFFKLVDVFSFLQSLCCSLVFLKHEFFLIILYFSNFDRDTCEVYLSTMKTTMVHDDKWGLTLGFGVREAIGTDGDCDTLRWIPSSKETPATQLQGILSYKNAKPFLLLLPLPSPSPSSSSPSPSFSSSPSALWRKSSWVADLGFLWTPNL